MSSLSYNQYVFVFAFFFRNSMKLSTPFPVKADVLNFLNLDFFD